MQKDWYEIRGGQRLEGTVTISGAKNAAVAIIPAAILAGETCVLENLPHIQDVQSLKEILEELGVTVDYTEGDCMRIDSRTLTNTKALSEAVSSMRASYYLLGALLGTGALGFYDDWKKVVYKDPNGVSARFKMAWQSAIALAAAPSWRWPAVTASRRMTFPPASACRKPSWASSPAGAAARACHGW